MAAIDVSELLTDPDFLSCIAVTRSQQSVNSDGYAEVTSSTISNIMAVVQPASGRTLHIVPDMTNVDGVIDVYTKFRLEGPSDSTQADIIEWQGRSYLVNTVQSFSNWGGGYVHAVAVMQQLTARSPAPTPVPYGH